MEQLLKLALIGTARAPAGDEAASFDDAGPTAALVAAAKISERERRLLAAAGVEAIYLTAGRRAVSGTAAPAVAPAETVPVASSRIGAFLRDAALTNDRAFLADAFRRLGEVGLALPHEFLPLALDLIDANLRAALSPLLSARGRWLAQFREEWNWVMMATETAALETTALDRKSLEQAWTEGQTEQRKAALRAWHRAEPDEARRRLAEVWKAEKADTRAELLGALGDQLTPADEPTLEAALDDRSQTVRLLAASLLVKLPTSQLTARFVARGEAILSGKTSGLIRRTFAVTSDPPQELDAATERDGIAAKPPAHLGKEQVGKRAFWLTSILAQIRPSHWTMKFAHDPAVLLAAVAKDDFADAVVEGWTRAAVAFAAQDPASAVWLSPLAEYWTEKLKSGDPYTVSSTSDRLVEVVGALPATEVEAIVGRLLQALPSRLDVVLGRLLPLAATPWTAPFASQVVAEARRAMQQTDAGRIYAWTTGLALAADAVPSALLTPQLEAWEVPAGDDWQHRAAAQAIERFTDRVRVRRLFGEALRLELATPTKPN
jgi:hypothetical protein